MFWAEGTECEKVREHVVLEEFSDILCDRCKKTGGHRKYVVEEVIRGLMNLLQTFGIILECNEIQQRAKHGSSALSSLKALSGFLTDEGVLMGARGKAGGRARA